MPQPSPQLSAERRRLRRLRRALPAVERAAANRRITAQLRGLGIFAPGRRVAVYLAVEGEGEVDVERAIHDGWRRGTRLYVPRITNTRRRSMVFVPLLPDTPLERNRWGIAEPRDPVAHGRSVARLDTVIVPVLGFDTHLNRLGLGAGYYDRALRRRQADRAWRRPRLIGVAYACQQIAPLTPAPWDVALDLIVTERGVLRSSAASRRVPTAERVTTG